MSIVIPTYNRGPLLVLTLEHIFRSRVDGLERVEVIVVDDGSNPPPEGDLLAAPPHPPFSLRVIRQKNAGPAAARNAGFRVARGELVVFVDDDILVRPDLVAQHVEGHRRFEKSVIFGVSPFGGQAESALLRFMNALHPASSEEAFIPARITASGHLSIERSQFEATGGLYREALRTPAAEEFEASRRLHKTGVPIFMAPHIVGIHFRPVSLTALCRQQHKYGIAIAEVAAKCPDLLELPEIRELLERNRRLRVSDRPVDLLRQLLKRLVGQPHAWGPAEKTLEVLARLPRAAPLLNLGYRWMLGASLYAGVQNGRLQFGEPSS